MSLKHLSWKRTAGLVLGGAVALLGISVPAAAAPGPDPVSPQGIKMYEAESAPDQCLFLRQLHPAEQKYRNVNNVPFTYEEAKFGTEWFDVACGQLSFTVPFGAQALVDLTAVAELDCQGKEETSTGWCGGRFLVNGSPSLPDNTGRPDSYAWDSAKGGANDWQANTLAQEYVATCRESTNQQPCVYRVQLQSRLEAGATSVWIDDLTVRVDVTVAPVTINAGPTTP